MDSFSISNPLFSRVEGGRASIIIFFRSMFYFLSIRISIEKIMDPFSISSPIFSRVGGARGCAIIIMFFESMFHFPEKEGDMGGRRRDFPSGAK